jgi:hypothetical protein
MAIFFFFLLDI